MKRTFDFVGLNTIISGASKPLRQVTASLAHEAGKDAGTNGTDPKNCHYSYFAEQELESEWYSGYRIGRQNRQDH